MKSTLDTDTISACVAYEVNGEEVDYSPMILRKEKTDLYSSYRGGNGYDKK